VIETYQMIEVINDEDLHTAEWYEASARWAFLSRKSGIAGAVIMVYNTYGIAGVYAFKTRNPDLAEWVDDTIEVCELEQLPPVGTIGSSEEWTQKPSFDANGNLIVGSCEPDWMPTEPYAILPTEDRNNGGIP